MILYSLLIADVNNALGEITVPLLDTADWGVAYQVQSQILASIYPVHRISGLMNPYTKTAGTGATGGTPTVFDVAIMIFDSSPGPGYTLPLLGPRAIFKPDGINIDPAITSIANIIGVMLGYGCDIYGNPLTAYSSGRRVK